MEDERGAKESGRTRRRTMKVERERRRGRGGGARNAGTGRRSCWAIRVPSRAKGEKPHGLVGSERQHSSGRDAFPIAS